MINAEQPRMVASPGLPPARQRQTNDHWYSFLADECQKHDGLLCFYDLDKSPEVVYVCGLLAECLTGSGEGKESEAPERLIDMGALPDQGENFFAPLKSLT